MVFVSWQDTYNTWKNQATLETSLKQELTGMAGDDAALEDAFMNQWNSEPRGCGGTWTWYQPDEYLYGSSSNGRVSTLHGYLAC